MSPWNVETLWFVLFGFDTDAVAFGSESKTSNYIGLGALFKKVIFYS